MDAEKFVKEIFEKAQNAEGKSKCPCEQEAIKTVLKQNYDIPEEALEGLCDSLGDEDGFFTRCMEHDVAKNMDDPEAFCAWLHNYCLGKWPAGEPDEQ